MAINYRVYDPDRTPKIVFALASVGKTDAEIAYLLRISGCALSKWKAKYPEIKSVLNDAHRGVDKDIENALAKAALGLETSQQSIRGRMVNGQLVPAEGQRATVKAPSVTAMIFWLKNRRPDIWRDTYEQKHSGEINSNIRTFIDLPAKEPSHNSPSE